MTTTSSGRFRTLLYSLVAVAPCVRRLTDVPPKAGVDDGRDDAPVSTGVSVSTPSSRRRFHPTNQPGESPGSRSGAATPFSSVTIHAVSDARPESDGGDSKPMHDRRGSPRVDRVE